MKTLFVTGGAGFIGSALIRFLLSQTNFSVVNIDKLTYAGNLRSLENINDSSAYSFYEADICDRAAIDDLLSKYKPCGIIHLAAESHVDRSIHGPDDFINTNILGTFTLLESALDYWSGLSSEMKAGFRFHHVSTDEVYGSLGEEGKFSEASPYMPNSPYSASKAASDHIVRAWHHTFNLPVVTTNCSNNYGPCQAVEKLIPLMINNAVSNKTLPIYGNGKNVRDWLYVDDHVRALLAVFEKGKIGEVYNIGGGNEHSNIEVVDMVCELLDELCPRLDGKSYSAQKVFVADRPGHDIRYAVDASKISQDLGWYPIETFKTGLQKTVSWYLENNDWVLSSLTKEHIEWTNKNYGGQDDL